MSTLGSELLSGLNDSQITAVTHVDGPLMVMAGPGSGKTRVITQRIAFMIEQGVEPSSIIGLTFTNKAAEEMRSRLNQIVDANTVWLGTFHGFCVRLLRRYARLVGLPESFSIYDVEDSQAALKEALHEAKLDLTHVSLSTLANRISYFKNRLVTPEILVAEALSSDEHLVSQVYPFYQQRLLKCGAVDFDDILMHVATLLRTHPELRQQLDSRFRYVLVDEYQDTNLAQYVIVRHLCVDYPNLAVTGDPDQSIYGWRGANIKNTSYLERDYPQLRVVRLQENYRSTPEILSIADCLIRNNELRKAKELVPSRESGATVRLAIYGTARQEAEDVADQIVTLINNDDYKLSDFGVLYRTNAQSRLIEQALLRRQIPYQLIGGYRFYMRKEIKDLVAYLLLINNPADDVAFDRAVNTPPRGIGKQTVAKIADLASARQCSKLEAVRYALKAGKLTKRTGKPLETFVQIYDELSRMACGPLVGLLQATLDRIEYREYLQKLKTGESDVLSNLDELLAEAHELDQLTLEQIDGSQQSALEVFLESAALESDSDRLKIGSEAVTLMTLHAAKGLEFPVVYIMAVEENVLPHIRSREDPLQLEEERRLLFVGITRAKDRLQLSCAKSRGFGNQATGVPSPFLMELPRNEMAFIDHTEFREDYETGSSGFSDADYNQLNQHAEESSELVFEDDCQLPPDELIQHLRKLGKKISSAADFEADASFGRPKLIPGMVVNHPQHGGGRVLSVSGTGKKQVVEIEFFSDGLQRSFRSAFVSLTVECED